MSSTTPTAPSPSAARAPASRDGRPAATPRSDTRPETPSRISSRSAAHGRCPGTARSARRVTCPSRRRQSCRPTTSATTSQPTAASAAVAIDAGSRIVDVYRKTAS